MGLPDPPERYALRSDSNGHRYIMVQGHEHDDWRDVLAITSDPCSESVARLVVETMNRAARPRV